jgi:superfamily II DNA or RNA helicase
MVPLDNIQIKPVYESTKDNILEEFYLPLFSETKIYKRVSAYFSSEILNLYAKGIEAIYLKGGKIRFIFSEELSERDFELIKKGYENREEAIFKKMVNKIDALVDDISISNLAFLIEIGIVDIKIAFSKSGILHDKFGLFEDDNNKVYFRGSANETVAAIKNNAESFETSTTWASGNEELLKINIAYKKFNDMWSNKYPGLKVIDIPNIIKNKLISFNKKVILIKYGEIFKEELILDLIENNKIILVNNIKTNHSNLIESPLFKSYIRPHIEKNVGNKYELKTIGYLKLKIFIDDLIKFCDINQLSHLITERIYEYILSNELYIEKRQKLGIEIKDKGEEVQEEFLKFKKVVDYEVKRLLNTEQLWNAFHAVKMIKGANFSVPGTGKTAISLGVFAYLSSKTINEIDKILMIGPISSFQAWKEEFATVFGEKKDLKVLDIKAPHLKNSHDRRVEIKYYSPECNLILINFDALPSLINIIKRNISERTLLIIDEVHKVKKYQGKKASHVLELSKFVKYKIVLTGTPIPNGYLDIYNILMILFPDEYNSFFNYKPQELSNASENTFKQKEINKNIYPFFCRISKKELQIPPPNEDKIIIVKMSQNEEELFKLVHQKFNSNILVLYLRLAQASNNPKLLLQKFQKHDAIWNYEDDTDDEIDNRIDDINKNYHFKNEFSKDEIRFIKSFNMTSKFHESINLIKLLLESNKKVIVWGIFIDTLNEVYNSLKKLRYRCLFITGATPFKDRETKILEFRDGLYDVLITNPHTLGESVSLHTVCHDAVYIEYSFNLTHMLQSRDRIHRLGLKPNQYTQYYYLGFKSKLSHYDAIDIKTYERLKIKDKRMHDAIEQKILFVKDSTFIEDVEFILGKSK